MRPVGRRVLLVLVDLVTSGGLEEVSGGLGAVDVGQAEALLPGPRVAVFGHDIHLQLGGVPGFRGDLNRAVIADGAGVDGGDLADACGVDALDRLFAERFAGRLPHGHPGSGGNHAAAACRCGATGTAAAAAPGAAPAPDPGAATAADPGAATAADPGADTNAKGLGGPVRLCLGHGFRDSFFIQRHAVEGYGGRTVPAAVDGER